MTAVAGEAAAGCHQRPCRLLRSDSVYASDAGMENFSSNPDLAALRKQVLAAGYGGEKVVFLAAADVPRITAICQVGADVLSKIGLNVDYQSFDWGTVVQRITRSQPIAEGGWSIFGSMWGGYDWDNPAGDLALRGNGKERLVRLAHRAEAGGDQGPVAARHGSVDAKGAGRRHAASGVRGCPLHAARPVLPAGRVPR